MNKVELKKWYVYEMSTGDGNLRSQAFKTLSDVRNWYGFDHSMCRESKGLYHYGRYWIMRGQTAKEHGFTKWDLVEEVA
jgi:hypothetical protein